MTDDVRTELRESLAILAKAMSDLEDRIAALEAMPKVGRCHCGMPLLDSGWCAGGHAPSRS